MSISWKLFRVACFLQMLVTVYSGFLSMVNFFKHWTFYFALETCFFFLIATLAIFAINVINTNYPDKPVTGKQKSVFNWLFLLNFLLLAFLFGLFFSAYRQLSMLVKLLGSIDFIPNQFIVPLITGTAMLILQFVILYGMYTLRRELYFNFSKNKRFEFEEENGKI